MASTASARVKDLSQAKSERELRVDTAAAYRLIAHFGMDDLLATHISCRLPGEPIRFLINPYGLMFDEIAASSLVVLDLEGRPVGDRKQAANPYGFAIHAAVHRAAPEGRCVIHTHTQAGMSVAAMKCGLLPLNQMNMMFHDRVAYYDYEELHPELDPDKPAHADRDEQERLAAALGDKTSMIMRNHGLLTVGRTMADAFYRMYYLEQSCRVQMSAMACNTELLVPSNELAGNIATIEENDPRPREEITWAALVRRLDRIDPSFRN